MRSMRLFLFFYFSALVLHEVYGFTDETDRQALLEFKSQVSEEKQVVLSSWNNSFPLCNWKGVTCGRKHKRVTRLDLGGLQLGGVISPSIGNLSFLISLNLSDNSFGGTIPHEVGNLFRLHYLDMYSNFLEGEIPIGLFNCSRLLKLYLDSNHLVGSVPSELGSLTKLVILYLSKNNLKGKLPASLGNLTSLVKMSFGENSIEGEIPLSFGKLQNLQYLQIWGNNLGSQSFGDLEFLEALTNCTQLKILNVGENRLGSHLPTSIANMSRNLQTLVLYSNFISGSIPHDIGNLISLQLLSLEENQLVGQLPSSIGKLLQLEIFDVSSNRLSGEIPFSIGNITRLDHLHLEKNSFEGTIPLSLNNCTSLRYLLIESNKLYGTIPREIMRIQSLVGLDVSGNSLTGSLPEDIGGLKNLVGLSVADNKLSGQLPYSLGNCLSMETLWLQGNYFDGAIPDIRGIKGLKNVDFSNNSLFGSIPGYLANFSSLENLNLSVNNFEGSVPTEGKFQNATIISLFGNKNLCGGIKEFKLKPCFTEAQSMGSKSSFLVKKIVIGVSICIALVLMLVVASISLRWFRKRKKNKQTNNPTPSVMEVFHEKMSYGEIRNTTDGFSSSNMIGSGSFGTVFKAFLPAENKVVAVKVLNMQRRGAMKSFMAECESLKDIRHRNLVKLLTVCSSIDFQGKEFKALIYEFMPNGSLDMWLHPEEVEEIRRPSRTLTLFERLNISIDVALVLDYLHVHCYEPIAHCDIKPSNVLLDDDFTAHVSDFGLARLLFKFDQESFFNQLSSAGVRETIGYAAPEYGVGGQPSIHGDVYSFGVLLLEMFTGKRPTDELFGGNFSLYSYIKSTLLERVLDIADKSIFNNGLRVGFPIAECLKQVLEVGLRCCEESPMNRLETSEATKELISIRERFFKARRTTRR